MPPRPATDYRIQHLREKLGERYEFEARLGRGAFAAVYLVRNLRLNRLEALKVLSEVHDDDEAFVQRFIQEAKLVASLDHPNIVKVYDFGEIDGIVWFSMQYVDGPTLRDELKAQGRLAPMTVARLAIPLLDALGYSHELGTVHRDVKPSNILLDGRGHPYIMDFGIAKSSANALKTMTGRILGTPAYISPEQVQKGEVDGRADLYALAVAMYEMLAGRPPFQAEDMLQTVIQRLNEDPEPLSTYCFSIDETLPAIVMRALAREPDDRFPDAAAMRRALVDYVAGHPDQQEFILMASPPAPVALERLPTTVPDLPPDVVPPDAPTVKMERTDLDSGLPAPVKRRIPAWVPALAALLLIAAWGMFTTYQRLDGGSTPPNSAPTPPAARTAQPVAEGTVIERDARGATEPPAVSQEPPAPQEPPPARVQDAGDETPAPSPSAAEPAGVPAPATHAEPVVASPAPATAPVPRRPMTPPRLLSTAEPALPPERAVECAGQQVILSLKVGEDGSVSRSRVLKSSLESCAQAALRAAQAYVFEPALDIEGQPVPASTTVSIVFQEIAE